MFCMPIRKQKWIFRRVITKTVHIQKGWRWSNKADNTTWGIILHKESLQDMSKWINPKLAMTDGERLMGSSSKEYCEYSGQKGQGPDTVVTSWTHSYKPISLKQLSVISHDILSHCTSRSWKSFEQLRDNSSNLTASGWSHLLFIPTTSANLIFFKKWPLSPLRGNQRWHCLRRYRPIVP